jgi:subtilisin family serine protease
MAIINFSLNKAVSQTELQSIVDGVVKIRTRSSSLKRVHQEKLALDKYIPEGKVTRGERSFDTAYKAMEEEEQALYQVWQIEIDENAIKSQPNGLEGVVANLSNNPNVEFAELNQIYQLSWPPNEPIFHDSYALKKIECEKAWRLSKGKNVKVAVVDSGLNIQHLDIVHNIARSSKQQIIGYNFVENSANVHDDLGHGTHVAGIIAADGGNRQMMIGVAPEAQIIPIKAFAGSEGDSIRLSNAIKFAVDNGADIINNSWAYESHTPKDSTLEKAIEYALKKGVICVFAAGNHNEDIGDYWIAKHPNAIIVASTNQNDQKAPRSNWGANVTLAAPGHEISSLHIIGNDGILPKSGTSMAAAHVSGAIALYLAHHGKTTASAIIQKLNASVDPIQAQYDLGSGRLNCFKLLN